MNANRRHTEPLVIDVASFGLLGILFLIALLAPVGAGHPGTLAAKIAAVGLCYGVARWVGQKLRPGIRRVSLYIVALLLLYSFLFGTSVSLQASLVPVPQDEMLISADRKIFGSEASLWMERFVSPALTEWMMFSYVIYIPALPILAFLCWKSAGDRGVYEFLRDFVLVNVVCYVGFLLFPVETPMYHHPEKYVTALEGGFFTWCGEWVRANVHEVGGGLPSPHCAVATVMLAAVYRHWRKVFPLVLPVVLTLYVSTVYCRYHYLWDALAGILTGVVILRWSPQVAAVAERLRALRPERVARLRRPQTAREELP